MFRSKLLIASSRLFGSLPGIHWPKWAAVIESEKNCMIDDGSAGTDAYFSNFRSEAASPPLTASPRRMAFRTYRCGQLASLTLCNQKVQRVAMSSVPSTTSIPSQES